MIDIHAHLYWKSYDADRDAVIRRALESGIKKMICVGTSPEDNPQAIAVAEKYEGVYASVGMHPHFFNKEGMTGVTGNLERIAQSSNKVIAIGECGLDYFEREKLVTDEMKAQQKEGLVAQVEIARQLGLPMIIHTRSSPGTLSSTAGLPAVVGGDAYGDILCILKDELLKTKSHRLKAILHCYQGDTEMTQKFLQLPNVYFSFAGNITYPVKKSLAGTKDDLQETLKLIPLEKLFVETDAPFLSPEGKRGTRNEPSYIHITAEKICKSKGIKTADLEKALDDNFRQVFTHQDI